MQYLIQFYCTFLKPTYFCFWIRDENQKWYFCRSSPGNVIDGLYGWFAFMWFQRGVRFGEEDC